MTEETPILAAGPRQQDNARPTGRPLAPIAWGLSVAAHVAIAGFLKLPERRVPDEYVSIDVELVVDAPVREAVTPDRPEPLKPLQSEALREALSLAESLLPARPDTDLAALQPDLVTPLPQPLSLTPRSDLDPVSVSPAEPASAEHTIGREELPAAATGGPELHPVQSTQLLPSASDAEIRPALSGAAALFAPVVQPDNPVGSPEAPTLEGISAAAIRPPLLAGTAAPAIEGALPVLPPKPVVAQPETAAITPAIAYVPALQVESLPELLAPSSSSIGIAVPVEAEARNEPVSVLPVREVAAEHKGAVADRAPGQIVLSVQDSAPDLRVADEPVPVAALIRPFTLPVPDPRRALAEAVHDLPCSRVEAAFDSLGGTVRLSGHVRSAQDREKLTATISAIAGIREIAHSDLHIVGEPYCQVFDFFAQPGLSRSDDQRQDVEAITQPAQASVLMLKGGMPLALQLTGPDYPSYVYVDYFTADGHVYHLLPTAGLADHKLAPGERLTLGGREGRGVKATIGPPFGLDMVVALASERPLYASTRPIAESADAYLKELERMTREARRRDPGIRLEYSYYLIRTSPR